MPRRNKTSKSHNKIISKLDERERAFLSVILMNKGNVPGPKLKRIYLEKFAYWEMQRTEKKLTEKGLLLKKGGTKSGNALEYAVPEEYVAILSKTFSSKAPYTPDKNLLEPISRVCCGEYSILWYLWQMDSIVGYDLLCSKQRMPTRKVPVKKIEELLGIEREIIRFSMSMLKGLSKGTFLAENKYKKWSDFLVSPHEAVREIFKIAHDGLRESSELGREDVGKDNIDFFFEELAALKSEHWYSVNAFVSNARSTLFTCRQPFRWIHFDEERVWNLLNQKLKMFGVVETAVSKDGEKFFVPTTLGSYLLGVIPERRFMKMMFSKKGKFMVHPNFEVTVVTKELNPKALLELAMFSLPTKLDTVSVFRISKDSVKEGLRLGLTTAEMTSFLKENGKGKIPQNVEYSINDWGS